MSDHIAMSTERLYLTLLYCRGDARECDLGYVEYLISLACEELEKQMAARARAAARDDPFDAFQSLPAAMK
jgi:hypothetical protein